MSRVILGHLNNHSASSGAIARPALRIAWSISPVDTCSPNSSANRSFTFVRENRWRNVNSTTLAINRRPRNRHSPRVTYAHRVSAGAWSCGTGVMSALTRHLIKHGSGHAELQTGFPCCQRDPFDGIPPGIRRTRWSERYATDRTYLGRCTGSWTRRLCVHSWPGKPCGQYCCRNSDAVDPAPLSSQPTTLQNHTRRCLRQALQPGLVHMV